MRIKVFSIVIACFGIFFGMKASAQTDGGGVFVVKSVNAALYSAPNESGKTMTLLNRGRRVQAAGPAQSGFIPLLTRTGAQAWIKESDVTPEKASASDIVEPSQPVPQRGVRSSPRGSRAGAASAGPFGLHRMTFDLGLSTGSVNNVSYTEANLGLNAYFAEWFAWRNAIFGRFPEKGTTIYGLDSTARGILNLPLLTAFAGPGYRFASGTDNSAPLAEAGLVLKLGLFAIGGGAKVVLTSWVKSGAPNDTQYFIILAGGGSL